MPDPILRTFIAIELNEPLRIALGRVQTKFKRLAPPGSVKWVAPDGIHLTLKFLGDTPQSQIPKIEAASESRLRRFCAVRIHRGGARLLPEHPAAAGGVGGGAGKGSDVSPTSGRGRKASSRRSAGPPRSAASRPTSRSAGSAAAPARPMKRPSVKWWKSRWWSLIGSQQVTAVSLIESLLGPGGAVYTPLVSVPLIAPV